MMCRVSITDGQAFRWEGRASAGRLTEVRKDIQEWARRASLPADLIEALALASYEAMANVADHAYAEGAPGSVSVLVSASPGVLDVLVADGGRWQAPDADPGFRGRGLLLIRGLADDVTVTSTENGTTVRMSWRRD
jgi:serine/threonine-protein kinase RsbW